MNDVVKTDEKGRWVKGTKSPNPAGRPKGRRNKITKLNEKLELAVRNKVNAKEVIEVLQALYQEACTGNVAAAKTFLEYTLPKPKAELLSDKVGDGESQEFRVIVENLTIGAAQPEKPIEGEFTTKEEP